MAECNCTPQITLAGCKCNSQPKPQPIPKNIQPKLQCGCAPPTTLASCSIKH